MMRRRGFTLIELVVAMAILIVLIYMGFSAFSFVSALSRSNQNREAVLENISTVLDQMTKELRQTVTTNDSTGNSGVQYPVSDDTRDITKISTPTAPCSQYYSFGTYDTEDTDPSDPIFRFYVIDDAGTKHRISYTLSVPNDGSGYGPPHYKGIPRQYWADASYEPCEILYSSETWNGSAWAGVTNQPVTDQVITNFTVIRPSWSDKVIQIVIEATVKDLSGNGVSKITRIAQITVRQ